MLTTGSKVRLKPRQAPSGRKLRGGEAVVVRAVPPDSYLVELRNGRSRVVDRQHLVVHRG